MIVIKIKTEKGRSFPESELPKSMPFGMLFNGSEYLIFESKEEAEQHEPVIEAESEIVKEKKKYDQRVVDGQDAYLMLMAELRITSKQYNLHRDVNKFIEEKLELVKSQVINGQWISAREKLDLVIVEGYLTQELYDRIKLKLDTYISENY